MNTNIKATNIELTKAITDYVNKRVNGLEKFIDTSNTTPNIQVEVGKTTEHHQRGDLFRAEINLRLNGKNFRAVALKEDLYAAIDEMKDEVSRELISDREKKQTLFRKGGAKIKNILRGFKNK